MNERLKELMIQADYPAPELALRAHRLAELIVRECVGVVEGGHFLHDQAPTALFAKECSGAIKRHFGVEEPKGWVCPKCNADRTKIACPLGFGATVDGRCPMTVEAQ